MARSGVLISVAFVEEVLAVPPGILLALIRGGELNVC